VVVADTGLSRRLVMKQETDKYDVMPFPRMRQPIVDGLRQARSMNVIHGLLEVDVTNARNMIREFKEKTGRPLSLTSFLTFCLARAIDENRVMHAYRKGSKLIVYDQVDIAVDIEREIAGEKAPIYPHVVKAANTKTLREIHDEIRTSKEKADSSLIAKWTNRYWYLPAFVRGIVWRRWLGSPHWRKRLTGTVGISSLGMFGKGASWGIPISLYTLSIVVGGISEKAIIAKGQLEVREYLSITASFDHDIIDGAPAARFAQRLKELIESGYGIMEQAAAN
jgi:pyruvate/2-oxoglutarate dehydrogenase complex dihydrolipoamide acyltransferase (E2) component